MRGLLQELHADSPHGPWAFVLSLTDWEHRGFTGGETTIFQPHMLKFWSSFDPDRGFEFKDMVCSYTGQCKNPPLSSFFSPPTLVSTGASP